MVPHRHHSGRAYPAPAASNFSLCSPFDWSSGLLQDGSVDGQQVAGDKTVTASVQTPFDVNEEKSKEERVVAWHGSCGPTQARHSGLSPLVILRAC